MRETLIAEDLLQEELDELLSKSIPDHSYIPTRISNLQNALIEISNFKEINANRIKMVESFEKLTAINDEFINNRNEYISCLEKENQRLIDLSKDTIEKFKRDTTVKGLFISLIVKIFTQKDK